MCIHLIDREECSRIPEQDRGGQFRLQFRSIVQAAGIVTKARIGAEFRQFQ